MPLLDTRIDIRKVAAELPNRIQHRLPERPVQRLDCLGVQVFHCLLVAS